MSRLILFVTISIGIWTSACEAQIKMTLAGCIHDAARQVRTILIEHPVLRGRKISIGFFDGEGPKARNSNIGLGIRNRLTQLLSDFNDEDSDFTLSGSYSYANGTMENSRLQVIRLTLAIKHIGKTVVDLPDLEINSSDEIAQILGLNWSSFFGPLQERNNAVMKAAEMPEFEIIDGYRIAAKGTPHLSVGILKKVSQEAVGKDCTPESIKGFTYLRMDAGDFYEIELRNDDTIDVCAQIFIDGLDVANAFTNDDQTDGKKQNYPGYIVPKKTTVLVKGWLKTIDQSKLEALPFNPLELGRGSVNSLKTRGHFGVVTVVFREAWRPEVAPPEGRKQRLKSEVIDSHFELSQMVVEETVLSIVSIRYSRPD